MPWSGGVPSPFLENGAHTPAWSSDGRLVYFNNTKKDALFLADAAGRNAMEISIIGWPAASDRRPDQNHNHNMVWSPDNTVDLRRPWRRARHDRPDRRNGHLAGSTARGGTPERLTHLNAAVTFLAILDQNTLIFVAPGRGRVWILALVSGRREEGSAHPRRIPTGLDQYTSVSASRDRGPIVATRANPTASLWRVPILAGRKAVESDVVPLRLETERALAPRYARRAASPLLFYLSARGTGDQSVGLPDDVVRNHQGRGRTLVRAAGAVA